MSEVEHEAEDHVVFRLRRRKDGHNGVQVHTPQRVLPVHDKDELEAQLGHYAKLMMSLHTPSSVHAQRHYVELIRPALRYYCRKFSREIPDWLATDDYYTKTLTAEERSKLFGHEALRIGEFQKIEHGNGECELPGKHATGEEEEDAGGK